MCNRSGHSKTAFRKAVRVHDEGPTFAGPRGPVRRCCCLLRLKKKAPKARVTAVAKAMPMMSPAHHGNW